MTKLLTVNKVAAVKRTVLHKESNRFKIVVKSFIINIVLKKGIELNEMPFV